MKFILCINTYVKNLCNFFIYQQLEPSINQNCSGSPIFDRSVVRCGKDFLQISYLYMLRCVLSLQGSPSSRIDRAVFSKEAEIQEYSQQAFSIVKQNPYASQSRMAAVAVICTTSSNPFPWLMNTNLSPVIISYSDSYSLFCFLFLFNGIPKAGRDAKKPKEKRERESG